MSFQRLNRGTKAEVIQLMARGSAWLGRSLFFLQLIILTACGDDDSVNILSDAIDQNNTPQPTTIPEVPPAQTALTGSWRLNSLACANGTALSGDLSTISTKITNRRFHFLYRKLNSSSGYFVLVDEDRMSCSSQGLLNADSSVVTFNAPTLMAGATGCGTIATAILANTNLRQLRISQSSNTLLTATTASDPACGGSGLIENFSLIASATGTPTGILVDGAYAESPDTVRMGNTGLPTLVSLVASNSGTRTPPSVTIGSLQKDLFVQGTMIFVPLQPNLGLNLTGRNINLGGNILVMGDLNIGGGGGP